MHNKSKALESSPNHPLACPQPVEKLSSTKPALDAKKVGDCCFRGKGEGDLGCVLFFFFFWGCVLKELTVNGGGRHIQKRLQ